MKFSFLERIAKCIPEDIRGGFPERTLVRNFERIDVEISVKTHERFSRGLEKFSEDHLEVIPNKILEPF